MTRVADHRVRALEHVAGKLAKMGQGVTAQRLQAEVNRLRMGAEALDNVTANRSPLDTEAAHIKKVADMARKFNSEVTAAMNRVSAITREGTADLQRLVSAKVDLRPDAFAGEIRAAYRTMTRKEKLETLSRLVRDNRGPELAALVKAPAILTGMAEEERARYESAILQNHARAEMQEQAEIDATFEEAWAATNFAGDYATSLTSPGKVAAIEQGDAAARKAGDDFEAAMA